MELNIFIQLTKHMRVRVLPERRIFMCLTDDIFFLSHQWDSAMRVAAGIQKGRRKLGATILLFV